MTNVSEIPAALDYDALGRIYEYFLGAFAMTEGQGGGGFYTPSSIVRLLTEIIEPFHGRILDPACGSGGMFVQREWRAASIQKMSCMQYETSNLPGQYERCQNFVIPRPRVDDQRHDGLFALRCVRRA